MQPPLRARPGRDRERPRCHLSQGRRLALPADRPPHRRQPPRLPRHPRRLPALLPRLRLSHLHPPPGRLPVIFDISAVLLFGAASALAVKTKSAGGGAAIVLFLFGFFTAGTGAYDPIVSVVKAT